MDEKDRRKSLVDRANDAYSAYQNAQGLVRLGKGALSAARGAAAAARGVAALAATSEIWGPIAIALILILVPTFLIVMGGQGAASETPPQQEPIQSPEDTSGLFTIIAKGDSVTASYFYEVMQGAFSYPRYTELITNGGPFNVEFNELLDEEENICARAYVLKTAQMIKFFGFSNCPLSDQKYLALHEAGHIISNRNEREYQSYPHLDLLEKDSGCFSRLGYLRSYHYAETGASGISPRNENFAEAIAMYIIRTKGPFGDFRQECPNTSAWVANNIFNEN